MRLHPYVFYRCSECKQDAKRYPDTLKEEDIDRACDELWCSLMRKGWVKVRDVSPSSPECYCNKCKKENKR